MAMKIVAVKADVTVYEGEGGGYHAWSTSVLPALSQSNIGAGKLLLHPLGFALPHFSDSSKLGYVLQGKCTVGLVTPSNPKEMVVVINKGDVIALSKGTVTWWFNGGDTDTTVLFLGETTKAESPGNIGYFFMTGIIGFLSGFQSDFVQKIFDLDTKQAEDIVTSQPAAVITKLRNGINFPNPSVHGVVYATIDTPAADVVVRGGGTSNSLTEKNFPVLVGIGLSAEFERLEGKATLSPNYLADGSVRASYIAKGSGRARIVGNEGKPGFDGEVTEGDLVIIPQFYAASVIADEGGIEIFTVVTSSKPVFESLAGNVSVWKALSPIVLQSALNVSPELEELFKLKNMKTLPITPPKT